MRAGEDPAACRVDGDVLVAWTAGVLRSAGVRADHAATTAEVLVAADLQGIDSHGVARLPAYVGRLRAGATATAGDPVVHPVSGATALVDGRNLIGPAVADRAMSAAVDLAEEHGVGLVAVRESNHFGIAGWYARRATERRMVGFACTNAGPRVAPAGADEPYLGTNPFALAAPTSPGTQPPALVVDMATSAVATGKLELATRAGRSIPEGWGVDASGAPTTDPGALGAGGWLLPLGSVAELSHHKGFALGVVVELLAGLLGGGPWARGVQNLVLTDADRPARVGHCFAALDPGRFTDREAFAATVTELTGELRDLRPVRPEQPVMVPGEPEWRAEQRRRRDGIPISAPVRDALGLLEEETSLPLHTKPTEPTEPAAVPAGWEERP